MGLFHVTIEIGDPPGERFRPVSAWVDTGAMYTSLPASILRGLGVMPHAQWTLLLADGRQVQLPVGRTWARLDGQTEMTLVVFAPDGSEPLLGAYTLEAFGLGVDPVNHRLLPVPRPLL